MRTLRNLSLGVIGSLVAASPLLAHHEWPVDRTRQVSVQGTVTAFTWANPHVMIALDVQTNGTIEKWKVGGSSPKFMAACGWDKKTLKPGDVITAIGHRFNDGSNAARLQTVLMPNGKEMYLRCANAAAVRTSGPLYAVRWRRTASVKSQRPLLTVAVRRVRARGQRPAETVAHTAYRSGVDGVRVHVAFEVREMLAYLGRGSYWIAHDHDASSKHQRFFRGADDAVIRQSAQRGPIDGIRRSVVQFEKDPGVRVLEFDPFHSPLDRDALALIVEIRMAVMRVRGGRRRGYIDGHGQNHQVSSHAGGLQRSSMRAHRVLRPCYRLVTAVAPLFAVALFSKGLYYFGMTRRTNVAAPH